MKPTKKITSLHRGVYSWNGDLPVTYGDFINLVIPAVMQKVVSESTVTTRDNGDGTFTHTFDFTKGQ